LNKNEILNYNNSLIGKNTIRIRFLTENDKKSKKIKNNFKVEVSSLIPSIEKEQLKNYFEEIGKINNIGDKIVDGSNISYTITFEKFKSTLDALDYNGADIEGRPCKISFQTSSSSFKKTKY
jgi:hypothetical protein